MRVIPIVQRIYYNGGCYIEDCFSLIVRPLIEIILPNIIKTDGGSNANFFIQSYANIDKVRSLKIFDRWGNLVYSKANTNQLLVTAVGMERLMAQMLYLVFMPIPLMYCSTMVRT